MATTTYDGTRRACYTANVVQAIVNNLAPLLFIVFQTHYDLPVEMLGRLVLLNFGAQLVTALVVMPYIDRMGFRVPLVGAHVLCVVGLVLLPIAPSIAPTPYLGLCIAVVIYAIGGGLLEVVVSPLIEALPTPAHGKAAAMSLLHSFYCWGQVTVVVGTTLTLTVLGLDTWRILPLLWAIIPLINLIGFLRVPLPESVSEHDRTPIGDLSRKPFFLAALCLMLCTGATELTMSQWSSLFAEDALGVDKVWGDLAGPCLFAIFMGLGRTAYGFWGQRIPLLAAMIACGVLATACYLTVALAPSPAVSLAACAVTGLAVSLMWPGTFSLAARQFPRGGAAMFGLLAVFGAAGGAIGPWLAGFLADLSTSATGVMARIGDAIPSDGGSGLRAGILITTIFPLTVVVVATILHRVTTGRASTTEPDALSPMDAVGRSY